MSLWLKESMNGLFRSDSKLNSRNGQCIPLHIYPFDLNGQMIFVGLMMLILSVFFLGIDTVFGMIVQWLLKLA